MKFYLISMNSKYKKIALIITAGLIILLCCKILEIVFFNTPNYEIKQSSDNTYPFYHTRHHNKDGGFQNIWNPKYPRPALKSFALIFNWVLGFIVSSKEYPPTPLKKLSAIDFDKKIPGKARLFWLGHSTVLIQINGVNILTDPIFSNKAGMNNMIGASRRADLPVEIPDLPQIDVVVIFHDHYDHLDKQTVKQLKKEFNPLFLVPLGIKDILLDWGIVSVEELDWWQFYDFNNIRFTCSPARHFSGRGLLDRDKTLWAGWFIKHSSTNFSLYFAGDTGYASHFSKIKKYLGKADVVLLPLGSYEPRWFERSVHIDPVEAIQAYIDLEAQHFVGIHWGTYDQTEEPFHEPRYLTPEIANQKGLSGKYIHILPIGGNLEL